MRGPLIDVIPDPRLGVFPRNALANHPHGPLVRFGHASRRIDPWTRNAGTACNRSSEENGQPPLDIVRPVVIDRHPHRKEVGVFAWRLLTTDRILPSPRAPTHVSR